MCDKGKRGCTPLLNTLESLNHSVYILHWNTPNIIQTIQRSGIQHWIFSGNATYTKDTDMTRMPMGIFDILTIKVLGICYSFQSALVQLGYPLKHKRTRHFKNVMIPYEKTKILVQLNYTQYIESPVAGELSSYKGESMMCKYKNAILMQFHPENTADGRQLLKDFLELRS